MGSIIGKAQDVPGVGCDGNASGSIALEQGCNLSPVGRPAVFDQMDALSGAQHHPATGHRDLQADGQHRRLQVGRHIVGAFIAVAQP